MLAPAPPLRDRVIVTVGAPDHASLVPASVRARTQDLGQGPRTVQLAGRPAWRYPGLVGRGGDETLDVTVLPGRDAVLSVACVAAVRDALAAPDCAAGITSVSLGGAPTLVPVPDLALRLQLPRVLAALDRTRTEARTALGAADTGGAQARWARRLASAHGSAADALRPVAAGNGAPLIEALSVSAGAYQALARAAGAPSASRFRRAQREVRASDAQLAGAVDAVAQRPVLIAAAPARPPVAEVESASAPGWLLPAIVLFALLVGGLVTLALRRPRRGPCEPAAGARRAAAPSGATVLRAGRRSTPPRRAVRRHLLRARRKSTPRRRTGAPRSRPGGGTRHPRPGRSPWMTRDAQAPRRSKSFRRRRARCGRASPARRRARPAWAAPRATPRPG